MAELEAQAKSGTSPADTSSNNGQSSDQDSASPPNMGGVPITQPAPSLGALDMDMPLGADPFGPPFEELPTTFDDVSFMDPSLSWVEDIPVEKPGCSHPLAMAMRSMTDASSTVALTSMIGSRTTAVADPFSVVQNPEVPMMKLMTISFHIAGLLGCMDTLWDDKFTWTVDPHMCANLPAAFQPTQAQLSIPHHPLFDLIPFPSTRSKLICVFAMPSEMRPPNAKGDMAIMGVVHDLEHDTEGLRASGGDGFREEDWEVGEAFAKHWWWALDRETIRRSNEMRLQRGARRLLE